MLACRNCTVNENGTFVLFSQIKHPPFYERIFLRFTRGPCLSLFALIAPKRIRCYAVGIDLIRRARSVNGRLATIVIFPLP